MASVTKAKNGKMAVETVVDVANQAAEETKVLTEAFFDTANKATDGAKMMMDAHQQVLQMNFEVYQQYSQTYLSFFMEATQQMFDQALALREQMDKILEDNLKKTHILMTAEQDLFLEAAEAFQAQSHAASERFVRLFTPNNFE